MKRSLLIARENEYSMLQSCMASDRSEFVILYGRRRVGKTYLVEEGGVFFDEMLWIDSTRLIALIDMSIFAK
ncbi:MAG: ATP-binding protein [Bacteroidales bacterium]|nr:ATP-binding protein [Bacteroidales bacterium]